MKPDTGGILTDPKVENIGPRTEVYKGSPTIYRVCQKRSKKHVGGTGSLLCLVGWEKGINRGWETEVSMSDVVM